MQTAWSLAASERSLSSYLSAIDEAGAAGAKERRATPKLHTRAARPVGGAAVAGGAVPRGPSRGRDAPPSQAGVQDQVATGYLNSLPKSTSVING